MLYKLLTISTIINITAILLCEKNIKNYWKWCVICIINTIAGVFTVAIWGFSENGYITNSTYGAIFLMPVIYLYIQNITNNTICTNIIDKMTKTIPITLAFTRINCIYNGCCLGKVWCDNVRYPTREAEIIINSIAGAIFIIADYKKIPLLNKGYNYPIYMIYYGITRFITEFFRQGISIFIYHPWIHRAHIWSILCVCTGVIWCGLKYIYTHKRQPGTASALPRVWCGGSRGRGAGAW